MPLPDPHAGEPTREINRDYYKLLMQAEDLIKVWMKERDRLKKMIIEELGDSYAGTVDGEKVVSYRPKNQYATQRLRQDYPDLTEHFLTWKTEQVLDMDQFAAVHPDIAAQYKVRAFVELG